MVTNGLSPAEISRRREVTLNTTLGYVDQMIAKGLLHRSDVLLTIPPEQRRKPRTPEEREVVRRYGQIQHLLGELYEDLRFVEVELHRLLRGALVRHFGPEESKWWHQGIPENVRKSCVSRRKGNEDPTDPYNYTDLIDIREIIGKKWSLLSGSLPKDWASDRKDLMANLLRLNTIRRMVMHPVRGSIPTEEVFAEPWRPRPLI